jgi:RNA polymerase subunit RPABC4/transcription elongation factor Spt4
MPLVQAHGISWNKRGNGMNTNLLAIIKRIIAEQGEGILSDPKRLKAFVSDYAKDEPKEDRVAFGRAIENGFYMELKNAPPADRARVKADMQTRLQGITGYETAVCSTAIELIEVSIFGEMQQTLTCKNCGKELDSEWKICPFCQTPIEKQNICKSCGKELQDGWQICPFCQTPVAGQVVSSYVSSMCSGSGGSGYGVSLIKPVNSAAGNAGYGNQLISNNTHPPVQNNCVPPQDNNATPSDVKLRHGFTSFWMWLWLLLFALTGCYAFYLGFTTEEGKKLTGIFALGIVASIYEMLRWNKFGLYIMLLMFICYPILDPEEVGFLYQLIPGVIFTLIFYGILKLKNAFGRSTWDQMKFRLWD